MNKRKRFEIFKRDGFKCSYCGGTPPRVLLEIDHINPKKFGGLDDINNLITACFDCNRGKSAIKLEKIPASLQENLEILKDKRKQAQAYECLLRKIRSDEDFKIEKISEIYTQYFPKWILSENFKDISLRKFLRCIDFEEIKRAMNIACSKSNLNKDSSINYFCGICWGKIKNG